MIKKCQYNKENKCSIPSVTENCGCDARLKEPINHEEEYYKLKKENKELKKVIKELKEKLKLAKTEENRIEWLESILTEYESEIKQLNKKEKSSTKHIRYLRTRIKEETEGKLERQKENIDLKNTIKTLASLL